MNEGPLISVVVPVYKVREYLHKCVDSILAQTWQDLEILLVDDGSPDDSGRICDSYAQQDSRVRVIHKENGGLSSARNAGIDAARGEYIGFVDSDDWIEPEMYGAMAAQARDHRVKLVCAGRYDVSEDTGEKTLGLCPQRQEVISAQELMGRIFTWDHCDCAACDKLFHRSLFETIRFPLGVQQEDIAVMYLLVEKAGAAAMLDRPFYNYLHRKGSITWSGLSGSVFQFSRHTETIYPYILEHYPAIRDQARFLRVRSLRFGVLSGDLADRRSAGEFRSQIGQCRRALRRHTWFLLTSPLFDRQERFQDLALAWGVFRPIHALRHPDA